MSGIWVIAGSFVVGVLTGIVWVVRSGKIYLVNTTPDGKRYALGKKERVWLEEKAKEEARDE